jgi:hypothetical protein
MMRQLKTIRDTTVEGAQCIIKSGIYQISIDNSKALIYSIKEHRTRNPGPRKTIRGCQVVFLDGEGRLTDAGSARFA